VNADAAAGREESATDLTAVAQILGTYARSWSALQMQEVADLWVTTDDPGSAPTYVAEELGDVLLGRPEIEYHLLRTGERLARADVAMSEVILRRLGPGWVLALFLCRWELTGVETLDGPGRELVSDGAGRVSHSRVSVILRQTPAGWRFAHYSEDAYFRPENTEKEVAHGDRGRP
jgi:hypothetical protein